MFLGDVLNSGAIPSLEMTVKFAAKRQEILAHNIANLDTPNYLPMDVSTRDFQRALGQAIDQRRAGGSAGEHGDLGWRDTREVKLDGRGGMVLHARTPSGNILFHDRNNRDLERTMQDHAENAAMFRVATELLRSRINQLHGAIGERVV